MGMKCEISREKKSKKVRRKEKIRKVGNDLRNAFVYFFFISQ